MPVLLASATEQGLQRRKHPRLAWARARGRHAIAAASTRASGGRRRRRPSAAVIIPCCCRSVTCCGRSAAVARGSIRARVERRQRDEACLPRPHERASCDALRSLITFAAIYGSGPILQRGPNRPPPTRVFDCGELAAGGCSRRQPSASWTEETIVGTQARVFGPVIANWSAAGWRLRPRRFPRCWPAQICSATSAPGLAAPLALPHRHHIQPGRRAERHPSRRGARTAASAERRRRGWRQLPVKRRKRGMLRRSPGSC